MFDTCAACWDLCAEWQKARETFISYKAIADEARAERDEEGDLVSSGKHLRILQGINYCCDTCVNILGLNVRWDHAVRMENHPLPVEGENNEITY